MRQYRASRRKQRAASKTHEHRLDDAVRLAQRTHEYRVAEARSGAPHDADAAALAASGAHERGRAQAFAVEIHEYRLVDAARAAMRAHEYRLAHAGAVSHEHRIAAVSRSAGAAHESRLEDAVRMARAAQGSRMYPAPRAPAHEHRRAASSARPAPHEYRFAEAAALAARAEHEYRVAAQSARAGEHDEGVFQNPALRPAHEYRVAAPASFAAGPVQMSTDLGSVSLRAGEDWRSVFESTDDQRVTIEVIPSPGAAVDVLAAKKVRGEAPQQLSARNRMTVTVVGTIVGLRCSGESAGAECRYRIVQIEKA